VSIPLNAFQQGYQNAIRDCGMGGRVRVFYAVKANANVNLLTIVRDANCGAVTVSGFELQLALDAGFDSNNILLNGNGKQMCV
jgi:diaminopimelate decarboxylase